MKEASALFDNVLEKWKHPSKPQVERLISKYYYGNTVEYYANTEGERNWRLSQAAFLAQRPKLWRQGEYDHKLYKQYRKRGYAVLSHAADLKTIHNIQEQYLKLLADPQCSQNLFEDPVIFNAYNHGNYQGPLEEYRRLIKNPETLIPNYSSIFTDDLTNLIISCFGSYFCVDGLVAWRNYYCPPDILNVFEPHANRWHFDDQYADRAKLFVYLSDVTEDHGPFQHFEKNYSRFLLMRGFKKEARRYSATGGLPKELFKTSKIKKHVGPVGTIVICSTSFCLHRAGDLALGNYRDVIEYSLRPSTELIKTLN